MRYYFHLIRGGETIVDDQGLELPDLDYARDAIMRALTERRLENPGLADEIAGWTLSVTNGTGDVLFSIPLDFSVLS
jgi:hypothetical protein